MSSILLLADTFPPNRGGSEATLGIVAEAFCEGGHDVTVYTPAALEQGHEIEHPKLRVRRSRLWKHLQNYGAHANPIINRTARLAIIMLLLGRLVWKKSDLVMAGHPLPAGIIAAWLKKLGRCRKTIVMTYGEDITMYARGNRMLSLLQKALKSADTIIATTDFTRSEIDALVPFSREKTVIIPPAVEIHKTSPSSSITFSGSPILFTVSRLVERKGVDVAIQAVKVLSEEMPELRYYVAGTGPDEQRLKGLAEEHNVGDRVIFLGSVSSPDQLFPQADIFIMPNRMLSTGEREGFGMVFLEAGLHGVPSIAGRSGGAVEAVLHEESGLVVTPESVTEVVDAIRRLASDQELRKRMGMVAKAHASKFSRCRMSEDFLKAANDLTVTGS